MDPKTYFELMNEPKPPVNCGFRPAGMSDSEDSDDDYGMPVGGRKFVPAIVRMHNAQAQERFEYFDALLRIEEDGDVEALFEPRGILNVHRVMPDKDWTFLHYACLAANPRIINFFLSQGASVNYVSKMDGFPPFLALCKSAKNDDIDVMKECLALLIDKGANLSLPERRNINAVMFASKDNLLGLVQVFLECGVDVNAIDYDGNTALHYAAENGCGRVVRVLLEWSIDVLIVNENGQTAYELAATKNFYLIAELLYRVATTKWKPGSDPNLLLEFRDPEDNGYLKRREESVLIPQKEQIEMTLEKLDLAHLMPKFKEHKVNYLTFLRLTDNDLKNMEIEEVGVRWKILDCIRVLHNADWNRASVNSLFLQGLITSPEIVCMMQDIRVHLDFMTSTMVYLINRLKLEPKALVCGSESATAPDLTHYAEATLLAVEELRTETLALKKIFVENEGRSEVVIGDLVEKKGKLKWYFVAAVLVSSVLAITKLTR